MIADQIVAGIDVSKERLDVHVVPFGRVLSLANSDKGIAALVGRLRRMGVERVGLEASGGYERAAARALNSLSARLKEKFDPKGIFNPGKMG